MGNVWGIANPTGVPAPASIGSDVPCPAGAGTWTLVSSALTANTPGNYYPIVWGNLAFLCGATPPTALTFSLAINNGAYVDTQTVPPALLVASATLNIPVTMVGLNSGTAWLGAGSTVWIGVNPTGQAVTFKFAGSRLICALYRGPDQ